MWLRENLQRNDEELKYMMTLTLRFTGPESLLGAHARLLGCFHSLHQAMKRRYGAIAYFWVREDTKKGMPHLHVLMGKRVSMAWLKRTWLRLTGDSWRVDVTVPSARRPSNYATKYLTKTAARRQGLHEHLWGKSKGLAWEPFSHPYASTVKAEVLGNWWDIANLYELPEQAMKVRLPKYDIGYQAEGVAEGRDWLAELRARCVARLDAYLVQVEGSGNGAM
jgi:hypothetical protein